MATTAFGTQWGVANYNKLDAIGPYVCKIKEWPVDLLSGMPAWLSLRLAGLHLTEQRVAQSAVVLAYSTVMIFP